MIDSNRFWNIRYLADTCKLSSNSPMDAKDAIIDNGR